MRSPNRHLALALCLLILLPSLFSCFDMGDGEGEDSFKAYFSGVYLLSDRGLSKRSIADFNRDVELEDMEIEQIVNYGKYAYLCFRVSDNYRLEIEELAFFAKTEGERCTLALDFYVIDTIPTKINVQGETVYLPESGGTEQITDGVYEPEQDGEGNPRERDNETGEDIFSAASPCFSTTMAISGSWDSALLTFPEKQTVEPDEYIVVRVLNNCLVEGQTHTPVSFTFNYLIFRFNRAEKL